MRLTKIKEHAEIQKYQDGSIKLVKEGDRQKEGCNYPEKPNSSN